MEKTCNCENCKCEMVDIFQTNELKNLSTFQKIWIRLKIAFVETISMH